MNAKKNFAFQRLVGAASQRGKARVATHAGHGLAATGSRRGKRCRNRGMRFDPTALHLNRPTNEPGPTHHPALTVAIDSRRNAGGICLDSPQHADSTEWPAGRGSGEHHRPAGPDSLRSRLDTFLAVFPISRPSIGTAAISARRRPEHPSFGDPPYEERLLVRFDGGCCSRVDCLA